MKIEDVKERVAEMACERCDGFGGQKTYANQVCMPIGGRIVCVDWCIHHIVAALNVAGIETLACCCGHGEIDGSIVLKDGREIKIVRPNNQGNRAHSL